jgi:hypothetical protein
MACGTPVIGSAVGGIKFSVRDGETGYLVPARDHAAVADRAAHLARHPELLAAFGRNGIRRVGERFTWDRVARAVAATYEAALLDARRTRRRAEGPRRTRPAAGSASGLRAAAATRRAPLPHPVQAAAGGPR